MTDERFSVRRRSTAHFFWGLVLIVLGVSLLMAMLGADLPNGSFLLALVVVSGVSLLTAARSETQWWLIITGAIIVFMAGVSSAAWDFDDGLGEERHTPKSISSAEKEFKLGAGEQTVDLREIDFDDETVKVDISQDVGEVTVLVPDDVDVEYDLDVKIGDIEVPGDDQSEGTIDVDDEEGTLELNVELGVGSIEVQA
jgi:predicted membrane protein